MRASIPHLIRARSRGKRRVVEPGARSDADRERERVIGRRRRCGAWGIRRRIHGSLAGAAPFAATTGPSSHKAGLAASNATALPCAIGRQERTRRPRPPPRTVPFSPLQGTTPRRVVEVSEGDGARHGGCLGLTGPYDNLNFSRPLRTAIVPNGGGGEDRDDGQRPDDHLAGRELGLMRQKTFTCPPGGSARVGELYPIQVRD